MVIIPYKDELTDAQWYNLKGQVRYTWERPFKVGYHLHYPANPAPKKDEAVILRLFKERNQEYEARYYSYEMDLLSILVTEYGEDGLIAGNKTYDDRGKLFEQTNGSITRSPEEGSRVVVSIRYDQPDRQGNWTQKFVLNADGTTTLWERTIAYFEESQQ